MTLVIIKPIFEFLVGINKPHATNWLYQSWAPGHQDCLWSWPRRLDKPSGMHDVSCQKELHTYTAHRYTQKVFAARVAICLWLDSARVIDISC